MKRDLKALQNTVFDVVIVGGGIYGCAAAWDASLRGMKVALIEKGDFGGATSSNSLKTIHGGLRYLQTLDLKRFRESVRERKILMKIAPHLVHPLPVAMPTYGHFMKGPEVMFAGLMANDVLSCDRNIGMDTQKHLPNGKVISREECLKRVPGIDPARVNGAATWTDAMVYSSERLTLAYVQSAVSRGAIAANYVQALGIIEENGRAAGVKVKDSLTGEEFEIKARSVLNTSGAWVEQLADQKDLFKLSTAMNIIVKRHLLKGNAAGITAPYEYTLPGGGTNKGRHVLFVSPWREYTIIGTYHRPYIGDPDKMTVTREEVEAFLKEVNAGYPGDPISIDEVTFVHKGFLPMDGVNPETGEVNLCKHYKFAHAGSGTEGLITLAGVKYTTARDVAMKAIDRVAHTISGSWKSCATASTRLYGGEIDSFESFASDVKSKAPAGSAEHLAKCYGTAAYSLLSYPSDLLDIVPGSAEVLKAEIVHSVRQEMAVTLADIILRRTDLGSGEYPGDETLKAVAKIMGSELDWNKSRIAKEIESTRSRYFGI
ncbi:glycerol-3-phosphate dehydrogenase/oxidase [bacterium]|nr:glycerol-3-phosphate dehydrogenase/oxidase [bacterium]